MLASTMFILALVPQAPSVHASDTLSYVQSLAHGAEFTPMQTEPLRALQQAAQAL